MADQQQPTTQTEKNPVNENGMENVQPQSSLNEQEDTPMPAAGTMSPENEGLGVLPEKAKVCCNCCGWTNQTCGIFWAIFNLVQLTICYTILVSKVVFSDGINTFVEGIQKVFLQLGANDSVECTSHLKVSGSPNADAKLSIEILMLAIYTIGSVIFCFAVFFKCLSAQRRSLFLLIYLATIVCLPLAYFIPIIILFTECTNAGIGLLVGFFWWYTMIIVTTGLAINITFVFRNWVSRQNVLASIPPPSQQQSEQMGGESSNEAGKETNDYKNATDDRNRIDAKYTTGSKKKTDAKKKIDATNKPDVENETDDKNRIDTEV